MKEEYTAGQWLKWYSHRNGNDGRRESAIGYNESKLHLITAQTKDNFRVACGKQIQLSMHERYSPFTDRKANKLPRCSVCERNFFKQHEPSN